jgi:hypothetical protein
MRVGAGCVRFGSSIFLFFFNNIAGPLMTSQFFNAARGLLIGL